MFGEKMDGELLREMLLGAAASLQSNKEVLNAMNVFPVPDGDTGTNMSLTFASVVKELSQTKDTTIKAVSTAMARGALKGARGNSGVILSQILRGMANSFDSADSIDVGKFAQAMRSGSDMAYKSVMKPKEGTILTVIKAMSNEAFRSARESADIHEFLDRVIAAGDVALDKTPEQNPVLQKAGVVDAGGKGLLVIFEAFRSVLNGEIISTEVVQVSVEQKQTMDEYSAAAASEEFDTNFPYCTEFFVINLNDFVDNNVIDKFRDKLAEMGDSLVVVSDVDLIKVHVHSAAPGKVLQYAMQLGEIDNVKIENMMQQNRELKNANAAPAEPAKEYGMVSVCAGEGIAAIMKDLGVDNIIEGGQTMNPSTEDILKAVEGVNAKNIFIMPNNGNIILAAQQVPQLTEKNVFVIPTKTVPQGMSAILAFNPDEDAETNAQQMAEAIKGVKTGMVTFAVRDTNFDGKDIKEGDIIGILEKEITAVGNDYDAVAAELVDQMLDGEEIVTVFYGADVSEEKAEALGEKINAKHTECEVSVYSGGQPLYYYIISAE